MISPATGYPTPGVRRILVSNAAAFPASLAQLKLTLEPIAMRSEEAYAELNKKAHEN